MAWEWLVINWDWGEVIALIALGLLGVSALRWRATKERLRVSEERLRFALDATSEVLWDWDITADAVVHPNWARFYGFPPERTPRNAGELAAFIHPDDMPAFGAQIEDVVAGRRELLEIEHRALTGSGDWKWMLARARVAARDPDGRPARLVGTCTDVTERRKLQARIAVVDRLASMGTLSASVAHEINNPLAFMMGNLEFLIQQIGRAERAASPGVQTAPLAPSELATCREALAETLDGAVRVRSIVRDLRVFSRAEEDRRSPVDPVAAMRLALHLAGAEMRNRARLTTRLEQVPLVLAEESRLAQVFVNLLVNAAQALPVGRADRNEIEVTTRRADDGRVAVEVRDTGCGIPHDQLGIVFDPFFTTKPKGVGTGLGLAICHGIVTAAGGEIAVESEVGRGSTFRVLLPVAPEGSVTSEPPPPARADGADAGAPATGRGEPRPRVLVVDDEPLVATAVARVLGGDHEVVVCGGAAEALQRFESGERFDVVLSDLLMPQMNGMDFYLELRRRLPSAAERLIFITGAAPGASLPEFTEFAARNTGRVLEKPLSTEALRAAVAASLRRTAARSATVPSAPHCTPAPLIPTHAAS